MTGGLRDKRNASRRRAALKEERALRAGVLTDCIKRGKCTLAKAKAAMRAAGLIIPDDTRMLEMIRFYKSGLRE